MTTYISTGGIKDKPCLEVAKSLLDNGFNAIELSGGAYDENFETNLIKFKESNDVSITLHNYIPFWKDSYIMNLASTSDSIANQTEEHIRKAIELSSKIESSWYAFHAGFLIDPKPSELGKKIKTRTLSDRSSSLTKFTDRVKKLADFAHGKNIRLMIENNVLSHNNHQRFKGNPLLLCDPNEIHNFFYELNGTVGLLLDLAHFKVSSNSLGFDLTKGVDHIIPFVEGLHISDNDGLSDQNKPIKKNSWFMNMGIEREYMVLEVYAYEQDLLKDQLSLSESI